MQKKGLPPELRKYFRVWSAQVGKAHVRNKIKRQIKNIIVTNEKDIQNNYSYVIIIKEAVKELNYSDLEKELISLIKKVRK